MSELATRCLDALSTGVSVQQEVRTIISAHTRNEDASLYIAEQMGKYREAADKIIDAAPEEQRKSLMKRVNNVVNDVSRICRDEMGISIKLKARKGGYVYKPEAWVPTVREPKPSDDEEKAALRRQIEELKEKHRAAVKEIEVQQSRGDAFKKELTRTMDVHHKVLTEPETALREMAKRGIQPDQMAEALVKHIKDVKEVE